jgi:5-oxoprolinase (ATP-hydrolysing)/N-methylhydantoinase A
VTDANVVMGWYDPGFFLGGRMALDVAAADRAMAGIGAKLGLSATEAAWGIAKVVTESMAAAARVHLVEKGKDPRRYAMVGFGGAGPAYAAMVARALGVAEVIIPPASGAASALGFLVAPLSFEQVRSMPVVFAPGFDAAAANRVLAELEAEGRAWLAEAGVASADMRVERAADMRLVGQVHEITVPLPDGPLEEARLAEISDAFARVYTARYTAVFSGAQIEAISFRLRVAGPEPSLALQQAGAEGEGRPKRKGMRRSFFDGTWYEAGVWDRYALQAGDRIEGPAIVEEREATTIVPPGDVLTADAEGNLRIAIASAPIPDAVVTRDMPLAEAMARIEADPIALEIMWSRLVTVVEEMWLTVCRTAFSLIISEAQDFACELLDPNGETLAHSPRAMPVFNLTVQRAAKALLKRFPPETLKPGDVLITNDPWLCAGHLHDLAIATPVFKDGRMVALMTCVGHVSDIGGTKDHLRAREVFEEGLQIPPMKLAREGVPNEDLFTLIGENVRNPWQVLGDIHSMMAANALGAERLSAFMDEYGMHDLQALAAVVQNRAEAAMREAIRAIPDGVYHSTISNNPLGTELTYPLKVTVAGDAIELDFEGVPAQLPQGGLNCTLNYAEAHATYPLKCMLSPNVRGNAGCFRPFTVKAPEGSMLNCTRPASVYLRTRTGWYIAPNIFRALSPAAPRLVQAMTGLPVSVSMYGWDASKRLYSDHLFMGGGQGASAQGDGKSSLLWPTSAANTSIELMEQRVPVLVEEKTYIADSGGPGRHRGGLGQVVRVRKLADDGLPTLASLYPEGVVVRTPGLFGGAPGGPAWGGVRDADGTLLKDTGTGELVTLTRAAEIAEIRICGGSGYGDPRERSLGAIAADLADGYVTAESAMQDYGVVLREDGTLDEEASRLSRDGTRAAAD